MLLDRVSVVSILVSVRSDREANWWYPMPDDQLQELTVTEIAALINALGTVVVKTKNQSTVVDNAPADDESVRDELHKHYAAERAMAERLIDLLDRAISVKIELED
jgi:hypothetical protein